MAKRIKRNKKALKKQESPFKDYWGKMNFNILFVGIGLLIIGFYLMAQPPYDSFLSLTLSPIVLVIAYFVVIPLSIFYKKKSQLEEKKENVSGEN